MNIIIFYFVSSSFCYPYPHVCRVGHLLHTSSREKEVTLKSSSGDLTCVSSLHSRQSCCYFSVLPLEGALPSVQFPTSAALQRLLQPLYVLRLCTALQHRFLTASFSVLQQWLETLVSPFIFLLILDKLFIVVVHRLGDFR